MNGRKTTVLAVSYGRGRFLVGMVVLMFCLSLFCSNAQAIIYQYDNYGTSDVYGIHDSNSSVILMGANFNSGYAKATAEEDNAYGVLHDSPSPLASLYIHGQFPSSGEISGYAGDDYAYGLYSSGSIWADNNINGPITATAYDYYAYAMGSYWSMLIEGNIGSDANIAATAGAGEAYGLYSWNGSIETGDIDGRISALVTGEGGDGSAYGIYADVNLTTGAINGNITAEETLGSGAYAMYAGTDLTVDGNISSTANISATAGGSGAYGLRSDDGSITINGDINGNISAAANNYRAYALRADSDLTINGNIGSDANITATAVYSGAYGLRSDDGSITINGDVNGTISAAAGNYGAYALHADSDLTVNGNIGIDANITATAVYSGAYGLQSDDGSIHITGDVNGTISAEAGNYGAYALRADSDLTVDGNIGGTARITAKAGDSGAYGLRSGGSITTGDIDGKITATATNGSNAYGLYSSGGDNTTTTGDINGKIIAKAINGSDAYGIRSYSTIDTNEINGKIIAKAGSDAYGLYSENGFIYTDSINGKIIAKALTSDNAYAISGRYIEIDGDIGEDARIIAIAERDNAYALHAFSCHTFVGDIYGKIIAHAGRDNAYGMYDVLLIDTGTINGQVSATADGNNAYGLYVASDGWDGIVIDAINGEISAEATNGSNAYALYSASNINVGNIGEDALISARAGQNNAYGLYVDDVASHYLTTGDIDGTITATADVNYAVGLYSDGTLTTGTIRGAIRAHAGGDYAYGILSYDSMNVTIGSNTDGGEVNAVAVGGPHAAAIQSGRFAASVDSQNANDTVEIVAGSTIVGDIDLAMNGSDNDVLTLSGGSGTTTFNDDINNVEHIYITGGTWYFNGNVYNSSIEQDGGILSGDGTLNFNVNVDNGGVLAPGGSIGEMTINGDLTIGSGGVYEVDVNNSEKADNVVVTGTAYLNGRIRGNVYGGERIDHSFDVNVLDAGAISLKSLIATGTTLFPIFSVSYAEDPCVILHVEMDYAHYATTDNQHSVGDAFNDIVTDGLDTGDMDDVLTVIENLPDGAAVNNAYDQIMPQDALGLPEIIRNAMNQYSESVFGRMDNIRNSRQYAMSADSRYLMASMDNARALPPKTDEWMPFAKGFGSWGDRDAESDIAGYQYNIYGLAGGVDKLVSDNTLIGISVAGSRASVDYSQSGTSSDIDSMFCSLYGSYFVDDWHVGVTLGYGHSWYDSQRGIPFIGRHADSDHQGNSYSAAVELGKNFGDKSMILEPVAGIGYTAVLEDGYKEKGAGALNLKVDSETTDGIYSKLGVRVAKEFRPEQNPDMILVPNVSAFWIHDFADRVEMSSSFIGGGSFTIEGLEPMGDTFNIGAGLNVYYNKNLRLFIDYGWQSESSFNSHTVQLGAQWSF